MKNSAPARLGGKVFFSWVWISCKDRIDLPHMLSLGLIWQEHREVAKAPINDESRLVAGRRENGTRTSRFGRHIPARLGKKRRYLPLRFFFWALSVQSGSLVCKLYWRWEWRAHDICLFFGWEAASFEITRGRNRLASLRRMFHANSRLSCALIRYSRHHLDDPVHDLCFCTARL